MASEAKGRGFESRLAYCILWAQVLYEYLLARANKFDIDDAAIEVLTQNVLSTGLDRGRTWQKPQKNRRLRLHVVASGVRVIQTFECTDAGDPPEALIMQAMQNASHSARLSAAWSTPKEVPGLKALLLHGLTTDPAQVRSPAAVAKDTLSPFLEGERKGLTRISKEASFEAVWTDSCTQADIYFADAFESRFWREIKLTQTLETPQCRLRLPAFVAESEADLNQALSSRLILRVSDVVERQLAQARANEAACDGSGIILGPWAAAVLLHETLHLGLDPILSSETLVLDRSRCLGNLPRSEGTCLNLALHTRESADTAIEQLILKVPPGTVFVEAPIHWARRNHHHLDVTFACAHDIAHDQPSTYYRHPRLTFDLRTIWHHVQGAATPERRVNLPCGNDSATLQVPHLYLRQRPEPVG